ncbi:MAG: hypothetical protein J7M25_07245 [Deltaproteobacteria bacterium]|nr:hypothetical protein [Deltaproteobacteria bacterium]
MDRKDQSGRKTLDRIKAMDLVLSDLDAEETEVGVCPQCGGVLVGVRKKGKDGSDHGVVLCRDCGYFYFVRS